MLTYKLYTLDVWGNESEGFEVNDSYGQGTIELNESFSDADLLNAIDASVGIRGREYAEVSDHGEFIEVFDKTNGMPVFHLYLNMENE
jgi:hypothetical protein